ncbi:MAG: thermostable hemolysin [Gammaproteobacteria bacterium]|nr:thermostable hemolysin [Gammaproteobacteria bacterium]
MDLVTGAALINPILAAATRSPCTPQHPDVIDIDHPLRVAVEQFIARRFLAAHGARISCFMPRLLALFDDAGNVLAAVGLRAADGEALFLEYYLESPVELAIADKAELCGNVGTGMRRRIAEIGNLASIDRRASRELFKLLTQRLQADHFEWAVFTGCSSLQRMFKTLGIEIICLGRALQSRLPHDQQTWGSYYEDSPRVVAGRVSGGRVAFIDHAVTA